MNSCLRVFMKKKSVLSILLFLGVHWIVVAGVGFCGERPLAEKVSPSLRKALFAGGILSRSVAAERVGDRVYVDVFVHTEDPDALRRMGVRVGSVVGNVATARLVLSDIASVTSLPWVWYVEASLLRRPLLDVSVPEIRADQVHSGALGTAYTGEGVIVGVYDTGIDWSHPDFVTEDSTSRILFLWDQTDEQGPHPAGFPFDYGTEYTQAQITDEVDGSPVGFVRERDVNGHGTHVAGIAAGNGRGTGHGLASGVYVGVAPEADLIVVKGNDEVFSDTRIADGLAYIFQKAGALGRPVVVNLSVGSQQGPHDGTSTLERTIDTFLLEESRAVVVSAGNSADKDIHAMGEFVPPTEGDTISVAFSVPENRPGVADGVGLDVWFPQYSGLSLMVVTPAGKRCGPVLLRDYGQDTSEGRVSVNVSRRNIYGDANMDVYVSDVFVSGSVVDNLAAGTWQLLFAGSPGRFDVWLYESSVGSRITSAVDTSTLMSIPANSWLCIAVGSYVSRLEWPQLTTKPEMGNQQVGMLSGSSSPGPTRDGRWKPEITAPGEWIVSSFSADTDPYPTSVWMASDGVHRAMRGTSMSAPHVAGLVALMFQADPGLTSSDVKDAIRQTARQDGFTGTGWYWDRFWGYGKVDALAAVALTPVADDAPDATPVSFFLSQNYPNPFNSATVIGYTVPGKGAFSGQPVSLVIYDLTGRRVCTLVDGVQEPGTYRVTWDGLDEDGSPVATGVYVYRLMTAGRVLSRKMVYVR